MSASGINYVLANNSVGEDRLRCYYDFSKSSLFVARTGAVGNYFAHLRNKSLSAPSGSNPATILLYSNAASGSVLPTVTGTNGFLFREGSGNFTRGNLFVSGSTNINFNDCSLMFRISNDEYKGGVIMGCFEKTTEVVNGQTYIGSKGFNFGVDDRGHLFFQSLSNNGEYVYTSNSIELSKNSVIGLSIGAGEIEFSRFNYINQDYEIDSFSFDTNYIKNPDSVFFGNSKTFYKNASPYSIANFSGYMTDIAMFSGRIPAFSLYEIGYGMIGDYFVSQDPVATYTGAITGYSRTFSYDTGVTGWTTGVTGYKTGRLDYAILTGGFSLSSSSSVLEGTTGGFLYSTDSGNYLEIQGILDPSLIGTYSPTGNNAYDTLGLQNVSLSANVYTYSSGRQVANYQIPMYGKVALTGIIGQTLISETPLYDIKYITGYQSGIIVTGLANDLKKDYIYFLGERL